MDDEKIPSRRPLYGKLLASLWALWTLSCCFYAPIQPKTALHSTPYTNFTCIHACVCTLFVLVLLSQHKTALHVQHPTRDLRTYKRVRVHVEHPFTCTPYSSCCRSINISSSHDVYPQFCVFHRFYSFLPSISFSSNYFPFVL